MRRDRSRAQLLVLLLLGACSLLRLDLPPVGTSVSGLFRPASSEATRAVGEGRVASPASPLDLATRRQRAERLLRHLTERIERARDDWAPAQAVYRLTPAMQETVQDRRKSSG